MGMVERITKSHFSVLAFSGDIDQDCVKSLSMIFDAILEDEKDKLIILDFKSVEYVSPKIYNEIFRLFKSAEEKSILIYTINARSKLVRELKSDYVDERFNFTDSISKRLQELNLKKKRIELDVNFVNPFIQAAIDTFGVQANLKVLPGKVSKAKDFESYEIGLIGSIDVQNEQFNGRLLICFPDIVFINIYNQIFGEDYTELNDDVKDAIAEFTNITLGQAKATLNQNRGIVIDRAIPSVLLKENFSDIDLGKYESLMIPLATKMGSFYIYILLGANE
ncbi:chemotaxis protein CheX [Halobacteriovorax sp. GFR7]|uniref:chemotaxis protein CheX n=1 Tax=unclassified Halobacteriovorax TaxID=2639665 RepID=UPI0037231BC4